MNARYFLLEQLKTPQTRDTLLRRAKKENIPWRTLYRASRYIGVERSSSGFGSDKQATWSLPPHKRNTYLDREKRRNQVCADMIKEFEDNAAASRNDFEHQLWSLLAGTVKRYRSNINR